jgi:hypothetical protein
MDLSDCSVGTFSAQGLASGAKVGAALTAAAWELPQMAAEPHRVNWIDPLELYTRWKPRLLSLCEKVCQDLQENT